MRIHVGSRIELQLSQPTPMIAMLKVHSSRLGDIEMPDRFITTPNVPLQAYTDAFGNRADDLGHLQLAEKAVIKQVHRAAGQDQHGAAPTVHG